MPSPKGSIKSRSLDLSQLQVGKPFSSDHLPTKAEVVSLARLFQTEKNIDPRQYPLKQIAKDITIEILAHYESLCSFFIPPVIHSKNIIETMVLRLLTKAKVSTPNLKAKDTKIAEFLTESSEFFDVFSCNKNNR